MKKIGYQGDRFSNNYYAAIEYAQRTGMEFEGIPLINSYPVLDALVKGEIDYAVVAYENSIAGKVCETQNALKIFGEFVTEVGEIVLPIHHCLFTLAANEKNNIDYIYSHEQALHQCEEYIKINYPNATVITEADTALAALKLSEGKYASKSAVICSKKCGEHYNLELVQENIETCKNNHTIFKIYARHD